ncbi:Na+/H+ antiporter NhaD/arsenite permease-like protein [Virgibacillus natechei]|uniref:Na+/H+ antiporter NhaD/arsenite permease-like protein n=1 Tax=Virgibacillus natechei TaxID=1216297 RepID=A0ABS4ICW6_9BACI|nr:ArsB/NhaD family transporter [Virgibacillus natechei]MBP1968776.1 Na+/H+ antiporter NhaD/arsenite permease-like protein [Virgibacillus natechei]UZD11576.1 ArsB/NhaD family transporter [Virgibacillus natechei]
MDIILATIIFLVSYFFIMTDRINRAVVALSGGTLLLLTGIYTIDDVFMSYIDWNTIALLFSMMVLISITEKTGLFSFIAIRFAQKVRGSPLPLLIGASILTAIGSALLDNVTTVLIFVPIMLKITKMLELPSFPFLLTIIFSSNIGGAATLIGDPPNIMIGQAVEHLTFLSFIIHLAPLALIMYMVMLVVIYFLFRNSLRNLETNVDELLQIDAQEHLIKSPMLYKSITVLLMTITGFLLHSFLHMEMTVIALSGAILLMLLTEKELFTEHIFAKVEWVTLFFFIGLFTLVGGLREVGVIDEIARGIILSTDGDYASTALLILWVSGIFSGIVDNIPFVAAMIPVVQEFESYGMVNLDPIWWSLALGACLGGNATLVGASSNVVVAGLAEGENQKIPFIRFMLYGVPFVLLSMIISSIYVYLRYLLPYIGQT